MSAPHPSLDFGQRWTDKRCTYRGRARGFDPRDYAVDLLSSDRQAKTFVERHHYSGSYPAARARAGLYRGRDLVGVAVFSVPMHESIVPRYLSCPPAKGVELGRLVLLDEVPFNAESWFLARAFRLVRAELGLLGVFAYSDPVRRTALDGRVVLPGHVGTIYQAFNGAHLGRGRARTMLLDRHGRVFAPRALSKIRNEERGKDYAMRALEGAGAPPRERGEDGRAYVARVLRGPTFRRVRHPGNYIYAWHFERRLASTAPFPKRGGAAS